MLCWAVFYIMLFHEKIPANRQSRPGSSVSLRWALFCSLITTPIFMLRDEIACQCARPSHSNVTWHCLLSSKHGFWLVEWKQNGAYLFSGWLARHDYSHQSGADSARVKISQICVAHPFQQHYNILLHSDCCRQRWFCFSA